MTRWFSLLLLMAALLGLVGQEAAFARAMPVEKTGQSVAAAPMSADCAEMMGLATQEPQPDKPCQGMTPDCIAKMGCAVAVALLPDAPIDFAISTVTGGPVQFRVERLVGRNLTPEPEPPAFLG
jgi:hypothetical protein